MKFITASIAVCLFAGSVLADSWGGALSLGPSTTNIIHATTTLTPGTAPYPQTGELFLWPGMSNGTGDLVQSTLESWPDNSWCGAVPGEWCVRASVFGSFGQIDSTMAGIVKGTDAVLIDYALQSDHNTWLQTVSINGKVVSTLSHADGPYMKGYGTGTECDSNCSGTIAEQTYTNTVITFDAPDPNFGNTLVLSGGTTYTGLTSSQGGLVWSIASIHIPAMVVGSSPPTSTTTTTSSPPGNTGTCVAEYGQCGGEGYTGATCCASGFTCTFSNAFYSQCL